MQPDYTPPLVSRLRLAALVLTFGTAAAVTPAASAGGHPQKAFWERLQSLCGARFEGRAEFPDDPGDAFRDQLLVAEVRHCGKQQVRIPFHVGADRSRTWIISQIEGGLELKHDHRHDDGTPDDVTMYGGVTATPGTATTQSFPADEHTAGMIPEAASNEWFLTIDEGARHLIYYLERHGEARFKATLTRVAEKPQTAAD